MRAKKIVLIILAVVLVIGIGILLASTGKKKAIENHKIKIVASNFASYDFLRAIIGDNNNVELSFLIGPGKDAHSYDPTAQDLITIQKAELFVYVGGEMENWSDKVLNSLDNTGTKIICIADDIDTIEEKEVDGAEAEEEHVGADDHVRPEATYQKVQLDDGVLYSLTGEQVKADIVMGDEYFDTTISDMYLNPQSYENKTIQIEGLYFINDPYTFVGRYSTSNLCPDCPTGYSYLEYQLQGKIDAMLTDEKDWIKVVGTLDKGNDETSNYEDYYFLKVQTIEIMNEKGQDTVNN